MIKNQNRSLLVIKDRGTKKNSDVSGIIGVTVLPTYSYARIYKKGNILPPHVDRKACEISLTVKLDCDIPWDIWISTPTGEKRSIKLGPGDAMIYLGCAAFKSVFGRSLFLDECLSQSCS